MENNDENRKPANRGNGDPVQRAARDARLKQNLRVNLRRRKQKAKALRDTPSNDESGT